MEMGRSCLVPILRKKNTYKKVKKKGKKISKQIEVVSKPSVAYSA